MRSRSARPAVDLIPGRLSAFLTEHGMADSKAPLLIAVSGGPDSVCLLHALAGLRDSLPLGLHAAHLDHQLRGRESTADAAYVKVLCGRLAIPVSMDALDVEAYRKGRRMSVEEAARRCRYEFFAAVAKATGAQAVFLGHTADDQAETILMHVLRGSGLSGFRGMERLARAYTDGQPLALGRPLLGTWRRETEAYCRESGLEPRVDSSNLAREHTRNRVRLDLLPLLRQFNPRVEEALLRLGESVGQAEEFLEAETAKEWKRLVRQGPDRLTIDQRGLLALDPALAVHLLRRAVRDVRGDLKGIGSTHLQRMLSLAAGPTGKTMRLPGGLTVSKVYEHLVLGGTTPEQAPALGGDLPLSVPGLTVLPGWRVHVQLLSRDETNDAPGEDPHTAVMDGALGHRPLWVRSRKAGDRFQPLGMRSAKKLQDFMVDAKIPRSSREQVPLLCDRKGILWVVGHRIDERAKARPDSERVLRVEFSMQG